MGIFYDFSLSMDPGARVNARDVCGYTPLHHTTSISQNPITLEMAKVLIQHGADVNQVNR